MVSLLPPAAPPATVSLPPPAAGFWRMLLYSSPCGCTASSPAPWSFFFSPTLAACTPSSRPNPASSPPAAPCTSSVLSVGAGEELRGLFVVGASGASTMFESWSIFETINFPNALGDDAVVGEPIPKLCKYHTCPCNSGAFGSSRLPFFLAWRLRLHNFSLCGLCGLCQHARNGRHRCSWAYPPSTTPVDEVGKRLL